MTSFGVFAAVLLGFTLLSKRLAGTVVSAAMVFALSGLVLGVADGADIRPHELESGRLEAILLLAELALALVLFAGAAALGLHRLRSDSILPDRLLGIGLPLTIAVGVLPALVLFGQLDIWEMVLLAALLAPTDAALAAPVVSDRRIPARIRDALDVEAGLNDGGSVPVVFFALAGAVAVGAHPSTAWPTRPWSSSAVGWWSALRRALSAGGWWRWRSTGARSAAAMSRWRWRRWPSSPSSPPTRSAQVASSRPSSEACWPLRLWEIDAGD